MLDFQLLTGLQLRLHSRLYIQLYGLSFCLQRTSFSLDIDCFGSILRSACPQFCTPHSQILVMTKLRTAALKVLVKGYNLRIMARQYLLQNQAKKIVCENYLHATVFKAFNQIQSKKYILHHDLLTHLKEKKIKHFSRH